MFDVCSPFLHFVSFGFGYYSWLWFCYLLRMQIYLICMIILYCFYDVVVVAVVLFDYFVMQFLCCGFFGLSIVCYLLWALLNAYYSLLFRQCSMYNVPGRCYLSLPFVLISFLFILSSVLHFFRWFICLFVLHLIFAFLPFSFGRVHFSSCYFSEVSYACID